MQSAPRRMSTADEGLISPAGGTIAPMPAGQLLLNLPSRYNRYLIVGVLFLAAALSIGFSNYAFGLFVEPLEAEFGWKRTAIQASLSFIAVGSLTVPLIGRLMDLHGARRIMVVSLLIMGTSFILRPLVTELWHWYLLSLLQFVGFAGASFLPAGRLVSIWFQKSRGRFMGITSAGNNFGGATVPYLTWFVLSIASWQAAFVTFGVIAFVIALLSSAVISERLPATEASSGPGGTRSQEKDVALLGWTVRQALQARAFYAMTLGIVMGSFTYSGVVPWVSAHLVNEGMSDSAVPRALSALAISGMFGKLGFGYISERITARRAMMISLAGQAIFVVAMARYASAPLVWLAVPLFGLFMGAFGALVSLIVLENFGVKHFGTLSGLVNLCSAIPFALGPLIAGAIFDATDSYAPAFTAFAALFLIGIAALTQARQADPFQLTK